MRANDVVCSRCGLTYDANRADRSCLHPVVGSSHALLIEELTRTRERLILARQERDVLASALRELINAADAFLSGTDELASARRFGAAHDAAALLIASEDASNA